MKSLPCLGHLLALTVISFTNTTSGGSIILREKINSLTVSETLDGIGTAVAEELSPVTTQFLRTGPGARAQVEFGNAMLRLGAETSLQCGDDSTEVWLHKGSALYGNLDDGRRLKVKIGDRTIVIWGDTGFTYLTMNDKRQPTALNVGSISGKTTVETGGKEFTLNPADLMIVRADGKMFLSHFNLPKQIESSVLVNGFKTPLPNLDRIQGEGRTFAALEKRGFVRASSKVDSQAFLSSAQSGDLGIALGGGLASRAGTTIHNSPSTVSLVSVVDEIGFQSRIALIAASPGNPVHGHNGIGNGVDPQPRGNPLVNDDPGTGPGNPGNAHGNNPRNPHNR